MVRLTRIYTRSGDDGSTGLADGSRRAKYDLRLESYGSVDELNSFVGAAVAIARRSDAATRDELVAVLEGIQHDLFDLGADLSTPGTGDGLRIQAEQVTALETTIDLHNARLAPLESFVLPGGSDLAVALHQARTVCRRAERISTQLVATERINQQVLPYLNRLSDLLFVLARVANDDGKTDVLWIPGRNRD